MRKARPRKSGKTSRTNPPKGSGPSSYSEFDKVLITPDQKLVVTPAQPGGGRLSAADLINTIEASILSDNIRQYVGAAMNRPSAASGVFLNFDRVWLQQIYQDRAQFDLFDEILNDPHVEAVSKTLRLSVGSLDWSMTPGTDSAKSKQAAEWCEDTLRRLSNFAQDRYELLDAIFKGFAASEVLWGVNRKGMIIPIELVNIPQRRIQFDAGTRQPKLKTYDAPYFGRPLPERKFIIHRSGQRYESPFGEALASKVYWPWLFKRMVEKFWLEFTQNHAGPIPLIDVPDNADDKLKNEALRVAKGLRENSYGYKPNSMVVNYVETKSTEGVANAFKEAIRHYNDEITKAVLGQILTTEGSTSAGTGARAGASVSHELTKDRTYYYAHGLEDTFNDTLIRWMCDFNFVLDDDEYPRFSFDLSDAPDSAKITEAILNLSNAGYKVDPDYITETLGFPILEEEKPDPAKPKPGKQQPQDGGEPPVLDPAELSESSEPTIYLIEHGSTAEKENRAGMEIMEGWSQAPIDEEGKVYAATVGQALVGKGIKRVFSSDLQRALDTAEIVAKKLGLKQEISRDSRNLKGWDYGIYTGTTVKSSRDTLGSYISETPEQQLPGGESWDHFRKRTLEATRGMLLSSVPTEPRAFVSHSKAIQLVKLWIESGMPDNLQVDGQKYLATDAVPPILKLSKDKNGTWHAEAVSLGEKEMQRA